MIKNRTQLSIIKEVKDYEYDASRLALQKAGKEILKRDTSDVDEKLLRLSQKLSSIENKGVVKKDGRSR